MKQYKVWLENEYCNKFPLFDRITAGELDKWLHENCECYDGGVWWVDATNTDNIKQGIPYNSMGYIIKWESI